MQRRLQLSDESVWSFLASLQQIIVSCRYHDAKKDEHLKENLIVNCFDNDIRKELYAMPDTATLTEIVMKMETLERASCESNVGKYASTSKHMATTVRSTRRNFKAIAESDFNRSDSENFNSAGQSRMMHYCDSP